jgi:hypothetical protein
MAENEKALPVTQDAPQQVVPQSPQSTQIPQETTQADKAVPQAAEAAPQPAHEALLPEEAVQRYNAELQTSGKLSEASYAELEQRGFPRGMVDSYVRGILAQQQDAYAAAYEVTGGKEQYDAMIDWATRTLTPEQKNTFNNLLGSADGLTRKMGVEKLNEMYKQAIPQSPQQQLTGSTGSAVPGDIYASRAEMAADMAKADYWKNPAEQRRVAEKIQRSLSSGVKLG